MAANKLPVTQEDCERAEPAFKDGAPRARLINVGGNLYLQITPSKVAPDDTYTVSKSWLFKYSIDGRGRGMGLGSFAKMSLVEAQVEARVQQKKVDAKTDPLDEKKREKREREKAKPKEITFAKAAEQYATDREVGWSAKGYKDRWLRMLEIHAYPVIGHLPVADIDRDLVKRVLTPLWKSKNTKTGKDLRGRIAKVLGWATVEGYRSEDEPNPAVWVGNLEHSFAKPSEVRPIEHHGAALFPGRAFMAELRGKTWLGAKGLEFAILTAARSSEVLGMSWQEINWNASGGPLWTCLATRIKKTQSAQSPAQ
jgi:Arm DNA-binding domain